MRSRRRRNKPVLRRKTSSHNIIRADNSGNNDQNDGAHSIYPCNRAVSLPASSHKSHSSHSDLEVKLSLNGDYILEQALFGEEKQLVVGCKQFARVLLFAYILCEPDSLGQLSLCQRLLLSLHFACCLILGLKLAVADLL